MRLPRTNTPLQALILMNDVTYVEAARVLAQRLLGEAGLTPDERIDRAFRLATARQPKPEELDLFEMLIGVDGVGPKVGLNILGAASIEVLKRAIMGEDPAPIRRASGVGWPPAARTAAVPR